MPYRTAPNVVLAHLVDAQRRHDAGVGAETFERVLHRQGVDHRREHAHVIGRDAVHAGARKPGAAKDVAAAEHHRHLHAHLGQVSDLAGDPLEDLRIDAVILAPQQCLAG